MRRKAGENTRAAHLTGGLAEGVAALEGARLSDVTGEAFASGRAAMAAVLLALTRSGAHVVAPAPVHAPTYALLAGVLGRFELEIDFVDPADPERVRSAMRSNTRLVLAETLAHPTMTVPDLPELSKIAREAGALLVVDSTAATPVVCRPLEYGADLVVHSATKYIGGHADATGGVIAGRADLLDRVRQVHEITGGVLGREESFLLRRGLETLPLRVRRQCANAMVFAAAIARHPAVRRVDYPGLPDHPSHEVARRLFDEGPEGTRFGACVTVTPHGGYEAGMALSQAMRIATEGVTGTRSVGSHVATVLDEAALTAAGVDAGAVRFSIGLEDAEDLIVDVTKALDSVRARLPGQPVGS